MTIDVQARAVQTYGLKDGTRRSFQSKPKASKHTHHVTECLRSPKKLSEATKELRYENLYLDE